MKSLAMDFGGSSVKTAIIDENGILEKLEKYPAPLKSREAFIELVRKVHQENKEEVAGISISIPGYVNAEDGSLAESGVYQKLWGCNILEILSEIKCPIAIENDGNCGALSEIWLGSLKGCRDGVVLILGSGIGGGIIKDGKIHHGKNFASGEISYMILKPGKYGFKYSPIYDVGMIGMTYKMCLAKKLSLQVQDAADTLLAIHKMNAEDGAETGELQIKADGKQLFQWLDQKDEAIEEIYYDFIQNLAAIINNIQVMYAPQKIAIGGGLSLQKRIFDDVRSELGKYYLSMGIGNNVHAEIVPCKFLDETNLLGAAYNFMQKMKA